MADERDTSLGEDREGWDERYAASERVWSGQPNPALVAEVSGMPPGRAMDAGAGEGGDAIWLAKQGWQVVAADFSSVGLTKAADHAAAAGVALETLQLDLTTDDPAGGFDLVTSHYLHLGAEQRTIAFRRLAAAVAPGGTLLIVGHDPSGIDLTAHRQHLADRWWSVDELTARLTPGWTIEVAEVRPRSQTGPDGEPMAIGDAVVKARRDS